MTKMKAMINGETVELVLVEGGEFALRIDEVGQRATYATAYELVSELPTLGVLVAKPIGRVEISFPSGFAQGYDIDGDTNGLRYDDLCDALAHLAQVAAEDEVLAESA